MHLPTILPSFFWKLNGVSTESAGQKVGLREIGIPFYSFPGPALHLTLMQSFIGGTTFAPNH